MTILVEFYGEEPVGIELPPTVDLKVTDTAPGIKGATASNQIKPATLETGLVVNVPPFINPGDVIRVSTEPASTCHARSAGVTLPGRTTRRSDAVQSTGSSGMSASFVAELCRTARFRWTSSASSPTRAGSKSSSAACSAARAKS